jgi:hypothetical protein
MCPLRAPFFSIGLNVPISMKYKTDKPERHKDGSGHHHPMGGIPNRAASGAFWPLPPPLVPNPTAGDTPRGHFPFAFGFIFTRLSDIRST